MYTLQTKKLKASCLSLFALGLMAVLNPIPAAAQELNIYSSRHYDSDDALYHMFEEKTGIKVNRIEDDASVLMQRIKNEGTLSPADVFITTDAGRLHLADQEGLLDSLSSESLQDKIPANLRHPDGRWFGFSKRARVIFYDKARIDPDLIQTYEDLARPELEGLVCTRSSSNIYMLSLMSAMLHHLGEEGAKDWAQGLWNNRTRDPEGGDTDQLRGIVSGQCAVAVANTYYFARALRTDVKGLAHPADTDKIGVVFPNQAGRGTHVNISGAGILQHAPNRENAVKFLEFLASDAAQSHFAAGNDEYPVVSSVSLQQSVKSLGEFEEDGINLKILGDNQAKAQAVYDSVGYK